MLARHTEIPAEIGNTAIAQPWHTHVGPSICSGSTPHAHSFQPVAPSCTQLLASWQADRLDPADPLQQGFVSRLAHSKAKLMAHRDQRLAYLTSAHSLSELIRPRASACLAPQWAGGDPSLLPLGAAPREVPWLLADEAAFAVCAHAPQLHGHWLVVCSWIHAWHPTAWHSGILSG